jgi:flagellar biogenesis protein FliO
MPIAKPVVKPVTATKSPAKPAEKTVADVAKPQILAAKSDQHPAKAAASAKTVAPELAKASPATKAVPLAQAPKPKAQLNGGVRIVTPHHSAVAPPKTEQVTPLVAERAAVPATQAANADVEERVPVLPEGEELLTADMLAADPQPLPSPADAVPAVPLAMVPKADRDQPQASAANATEDLGSVVIGDVSIAPPVSPTVIVMAVFAIGFFALWLWLRRRPTPPTPLTLLQQKAVSVIETISLAPGRQIVLVEVSGSALVLGVTPQSINLLERLPLALLAQNYQPTVESIIHRESAQTAQWAEAPRMAAAGGGRPVMPFTQPRVSGTAVRTSLAELRREQAARGQKLSVVGSEAERD